MHSDAPAPDRDGVNGVLQPLPAPSIAHLRLDERIRLLLQRMVEIAGADLGAVLLAEPTGELVPRAWVGLDADELRGTTYRVGEGFAGIVAQTGTPAAIHDLREDATLVHRHLRDRGVRTVVGLPLRAQARVLGLAYVASCTPRTLGDDQVRRLAVAADHIAAVAELAWLYEESQSRNAELERVNAELRELDRLKGDFLSTISHELRTPLTAVIGYTDLLIRQVHGPLNERQQQHELAVKKAAHRLLELINDLLDVTRLESGHVELSTGPVPLPAAFRRVGTEVQSAADQRGIELRTELPPALPPACADAERLHQILVNLLENAIKFTPSGGTVTLRAARDGEMLRICVSDTGVGVPPEQLDRIWDRFHQVDSSARRRFGGTGLGLAIVRNLVQLHGGSVHAHSAGAGAGSTFCFTLPSADVAIEPPAPAPAPGPVAGPLGRLRILIVDDEPDNREVIASIVSDVLGHEPILAEDGEQALQRTREGPDLILLDLRMPGLSGFEVAQHVRADAATARLPIVAITALDARDDQEAAIAAGCNGCITKPFTPAKLTESISHALRSAAPASRAIRG